MLSEEVKKDLDSIIAITVINVKTSPNDNAPESGNLSASADLDPEL
jgi:hypothetical protein